MNISGRDRARFFSKVRIGLADECWLWLAGKDKDGYGRFWINGRTRRAHRISYAIAHGEEMPDEMETLHSCDNPPCVNPAHIRPGTSLDNSRECVQKGRHIWTTHPEKCPRGERHFLYGQVVCRMPGESNPAAKLTEEQVIAIRLAHRNRILNNKQIAALYGVSNVLIGLIVRRLAWRHV